MSIFLGHGCIACNHGYDERPKEFGYWNDKERCVEEARKYRNKKEFQFKSYGCYSSMKRNGWLSELDGMYDGTILYMGYDEKINVVYVYEMKDFNTFYVGRTNNIIRRDRQHRNGYGHSNGDTEFDGLYKFCEEKGIEVPKPKILAENLNALESQEQEDYWKNKYIEDGWVSLNKAKTRSIRWFIGSNKEVDV